MPAQDRVVVFATKGSGSNDEARIVALLAPLSPVVWPFDRSSKPRACLQLFARLLRNKPGLVVMEGTGLAGGLALIAARVLFGTSYVVSSGDAVAPFFGLTRPYLTPFGHVYERLLYRGSVGFIGWTPYLVGRALTMGAPRAVTAENWAASEAADDRRDEIRERLGVPDDQLVIGIVGSLSWSARRQYCYGLELVRAVRRTDRPDVTAVIIGDGDGRERLEAEAGDELGRRVLIPGAVDGAEVPAYLAAFDVGSLPQSLDGVGSFRYTTKLSEYAAAGLPIVTGRIPAAYDLDEGGIWRLPGSAPWDDEYVNALSGWMERLTREEITQRAARMPRTPAVFDKGRQVTRVTAFISELAS